METEWDSIYHLSCWQITCTWRAALWFSLLQNCTEALGKQLKTESHAEKQKYLEEKNENITIIYNLLRSIFDMMHWGTKNYVKYIWFIRLGGFSWLFSHYLLVLCISENAKHENATERLVSLNTGTIPLAAADLLCHAEPAQPCCRTTATAAPPAPAHAASPGAQQQDAPSRLRPHQQWGRAAVSHSSGTG